MRVHCTDSPDCRCCLCTAAYIASSASEHGANSRRTRRCSVQPIVLRRALARDGDNEVGLEGNPPFPGERSEPGNTKAEGLR